MLKYELVYRDFGGAFSLTKYINENNITPKRIQSIIYDSNVNHHRLFYWEKKES